MKGCELCFDWQFVLAESYTFSGSGLAAGNYYLWCYKSNNAVVSFQITVDSSGDITFDADQFPDGWINQYGGDYYFEFSSDVNGNNMENLIINAQSYNCLLLNFVCN